MAYHLELAKENFKIAAAHFAIFGPSCAERLHGHNYYVSLTFETDVIDSKLGLSVEFNELKPIIKKACEELDEYVLFPEKSPYLKISKEKDSYKIIFAKKTYILPVEDVKLVPVLNISVEELSAYIWKRLKKAFKKYPQIKKFSVTVEETRGQRGTYTE
ncbi:MAG: 6-carboxytetrahydropterin synthase [Oligoflexia bacterium]|nr:6-carboxytetrahydropterin synthase [Oligoflexia bacterium]